MAASDHESRNAVWLRATYWISAPKDAASQGILTRLLVIDASIVVSAGSELRCIRCGESLCVLGYPQACSEFYALCGLQRPDR